MEEKKQTLLVVEDDLDIADMLNAYFRVQGYEVMTVNWGEDGVRACHTSPPDLVILDIRLPDIDGFEVAKRLRTNRKTRDIPIIFLTEKRERSDRLRGLELQADDYITKPFDITELRLRVRNALGRSRQQPLTSPITGFPEGALLDEALEAALERDLVVTALTIQNLAGFRDLYGFVAGDDLLRAAGMMLNDVLVQYGETGAMVGHYRRDCLILAAPPALLPALKDSIRRKMDPAFELFYSDEHRAAGLSTRQPLHVCFDDAVPPAGGFQSLAQLKSELDRLCR